MMRTTLLNTDVLWEGEGEGEGEGGGWREQFTCKYSSEQSTQKILLLFWFQSN